MLESFARFGTRLDAHTRQAIEHGRRIRACLKQPEGEPLSVPEQVSVLLALTAGLFDSVPLEKMREAERAVIDLAATIPEPVCQGLDASEDFSPSGCELILEAARKLLVPFQNHKET